MGTFIGHFANGTFLCLFSLWWLVHHLTAYHVSRRTGRPFVSRVYFDTWAIKNIPFESIFKIISTSAVVVGEFIGGYNRGNELIVPGNTQHITMVTAFMMLGVTEILAHRHVDYLPPHSTYAMAIIALSVEWLLFSFHHAFMEESMLEKTLHDLLVMVIAAGVAALVVEAFNRHLAVVAVMRCWLILWQGLWLQVVGFIIYPPWRPYGQTLWRVDSMHNVMYAATLFVAVGLATLVLVGVISAICRRCIDGAGYIRKDPTPTYVKLVEESTNLIDPNQIPDVQISMMEC